MKLLRIGERGVEIPALLDNGAVLRDCSSVTGDFTPTWLESGGVAELAELHKADLPEIEPGQRIGAPIANIGKVVCVGLNYSDHAAEAGQAPPDEPVLFMKPTTTVQGPNDPIILPPFGEKVDWEVELAIIIGKRASYVELNDARSYIAGFSIFHDVSERAFQLERGGQWVKGKGCDTFGPLGPWLVTVDEFSFPLRLDLKLAVNGELMQSGKTKKMIFDVEYLVHYISQFMTLEAGDVISTGTPPGVGMGQKPPRYLKDADVVNLSIDKLGEQRQRVVSFGSDRIA